MTPTLAEPPEGLGTIESGGRDVGFGDGFGDGVLIRFFSLTVTLIFCPGFKFSRPNFAPDPEVDGFIASGFGVGFADGFGVGFADGFGVGFGAGFTGFSGVLGLSGDCAVDVSVGGTLGVTGFGVMAVEVSEVGKVVGVLGAGTELLGAATTRKICSGITGALICEGADTPTEVTVATVNV